MSSFFNAFALLLVTCQSKSNNAGASTFHGKTNAWPTIQLMQSKAVWTHFVYLVADNNLDYFAAYNLEAMRQNTATRDELNLVVYVDRCSGCDGSSFQRPINNITDCSTNEAISGRFNGSKLLQKNGEIWCQIYDFGHELDSMQPQAIANFTALMGQYQLTSTFFALTFWDHGGAWSGFGSDEHTAMADQNETVGNLDQLFSAVQNGLQETYLGRLDILGFDACIMADYSVLHYISEYDITKYYIASEVSEPGVGWDYQGINASSQNAIAYSKAIIDSYVEQGDVQSSNAGAGYTLALFDMDEVDKYLNEFNSFIRMITLAVEAYDYGMIMAVLRGESATVAAEQDFYIYDMGLFLNNFVNDENIFWNTCNERLKMSGQRVLNYLSDAVIYFGADFVRKHMTGSTIFYSTSFAALGSFYYYNNDLISDNYIDFLVAMNSSLTVLQTYPEYLTNYSCSARKPANLSFGIDSSRGVDVMYSSTYGLYQLSVDVTATVMAAKTYILYPNTSIMAAQIDTDIRDKDFDSTQLLSYWDGNIGFFVNALDGNDSNLSDYMFSSGAITFSSTANGDVPHGYIIKYPLLIYDSLEEKKQNNSHGNNGYIEFGVVLDIDVTNISVIPLSSVQLYEIDTYSSVISQVKKSTNKIIEGLLTLADNTNATFAAGTLMWPNLTIFFVQSSGAQIIISGNDVFGNFDYVTFDLLDMNISNLNVSMQTVSPTLSPITSNTTPSPSKSPVISTSSPSEYEDKSSNKSKGLDIIPSYVWLIIVVLLIIVIIALCVLFLKVRKHSGLIVDTSYVQMAN